MATSCLVSALAIITPAAANPTGASVVAGQAVVSQTAQSTLVQQSTQKAVINWQSLSLAPNQSLTFAQPNQQSFTLNRVTGNGTSFINGSVAANGNVWFINPNGILFGANSQVNVGEQDAVRIDEPDIAVGGDRAVDERGAVAGDAVQREGLLIGMGEGQGLVRGQRQALPVDHRLLGRLLDEGALGGLRHDGLAGDDAGAGRVGRGGRDYGQGRHQTARRHQRRLQPDLLFSPIRRQSPHPLLRPTDPLA